MKQLLDFIPLFIFFALYKLQGIYVATGALIIATAIQLIVTYWAYKKVDKMQRVTFFLVALFGGMTLFFHDDNFIKWKVTLVYSVFALGLAVSHFMGKSAIRTMLNNEVCLPNSAWAKITWAWVTFFLFCATSNLYIAFRFPLDVWVNFKVFGLLTATLGFTLLTGFYIYRHRTKDPSTPTTGD